MTLPALLLSLGDTALIRRFLDGDEQAFRALYRRHTPRLRMILARLLGPRRDEVDDVVQETWLSGCRGIHRYNGDAKFASWLTTIGIRAAYARFSPANGVEVDLSDDLLLAGREGDDVATTVDLERAMDRLPDHQRAVVVLHDVEGFTHEEIAQQLGIAPGTSKATLSRARQALRFFLTDGAPHA